MPTLDEILLNASLQPEQAAPEVNPSAAQLFGVQPFNPVPSVPAVEGGIQRNREEVEAFAPALLPVPDDPKPHTTAAVFQALGNALRAAGRQRVLPPSVVNEFRRRRSEKEAIERENASRTGQAQQRLGQFRLGEEREDERTSTASREREFDRELRRAEGEANRGLRREELESSERKNELIEGNRSEIARLREGLKDRALSKQEEEAAATLRRQLGATISGIPAVAELFLKLDNGQEVTPEELVNADKLVKRAIRRLRLGDDATADALELWNEEMNELAPALVTTRDGGGISLGGPLTVFDVPGPDDELSAPSLAIENALSKSGNAIKRLFD